MKGKGQPPGGRADGARTRLCQRIPTPQYLAMDVTKYPCRSSAINDHGIFAENTLGRLEKTEHFSFTHKRKRRCTKEFVLWRLPPFDAVVGDTAQVSRKREMTACAHVLVRVWCCCADCDACVTLGRRHEGSIVGCTYRLSRTVSRTRCATASTSRETKGSFGGLAKFIIDTFRIVSGGCGRVLT
jgi:hypothetical protein